MPAPPGRGGNSIYAFANHSQKCRVTNHPEGVSRLESRHRQPRLNAVNMNVTVCSVMHGRDPGFMISIRRAIAIAVAIAIVSPCFGFKSPAWSSESHRVQITFDASEAQMVLALLLKRRQAQPITEADWNALFSSEPYRRLKLREEAMHVPFDDQDFKAFVLSDGLAAQYDELRNTLDAWSRTDLNSSALRVLRYLPTQARISVKVFPEIKPRHNSFVFDTETDPVIFLYIDPTVSADAFENTVAHEMHHIGLANTDALYAKKIAALPPGRKKAAEWMGAFGEGLAVLAAAGGADISPTRFSQPDIKENWERAMQNFDMDVASLNEFFLDVVDGRLQGEAADQKALTFFGKLQGPWYTVGYRMATLVEKRYGRPTLIECMLDRRLLLVRYNSAAAELNRKSSVQLPLWSESIISQ